MRRSWCYGIAACCLLLLTGFVSANDSGPGPTAGAASKQYNVVVVRANGFEQGMFTFATTETSSGGDADGNETDGNQVDTGTPVNPDTGAGNDPDADSSNPTATGDFGNVGTSIGSSNNTGTGGTTTTNTGTTSDPPSYWTTARANGQIASETNDPSSSNYWTTARANGRGGSASAGGNNNAGGESATARGTLVIVLDEQSTTANWYSVDLGGFSLWYATASSAGSSTGSMNIVGYATPEIIVGRMANVSGGMMEAMFNGSFFVGQAAEEISVDE